MNWPKFYTVEYSYHWEGNARTDATVEELPVGYLIYSRVAESLIVGPQVNLVDAHTVKGIGKYKYPIENWQGDYIANHWH